MATMDIIFVTGMGRSGTSAITRILSLCGAALPDRLLRPGDGNPKGYWEAEVAIKRNDQFMHAFGTAYLDPSLRILDAEISDRVRDLHARNIGVFLRELPEADAVVVKDPRISGLVTSWDTVSRSQQLTPKYIHIFRHPSDVAASLKARYGMQPGYASALWLKYNLLPERMTRHAPRVFISYRELLDDWQQVVRKCNDRLKLSLAFNEDAIATANQFLSPELEHHRTEESDVVDDLTPGLWLRRTYSILKNAAEIGSIDEREADCLFQEYAGAERFFRDAHCSYQDRFPSGGPKRSSKKKEAAPKDVPALLTTL
jgi:hypothetical protein